MKYGFIVYLGYEKLMEVNIEILQCLLHISGMQPCPQTKQ